jgi:hypothetical protein
MKYYDKEIFIKLAKEKHNNYFDYSKVDYKNVKTPVCIIDPIYGEFWQQPNMHLEGRKHPKTPRKTRNTKKFTQEEFIEKCKKIHGDLYDYSLVEYKNAQTKVKIIDKTYGVFEITPAVLLNGGGNKQRGHEKSSNKRRITIEQFLERAKKVHGDLYDYSKVEYVNCDTKILISHPTLGDFWQTPYQHVNQRSGHPKAPKKQDQIDHIIPLSIICTQKIARNFDKNRPLFKFLNSDINLRTISGTENRKKSSFVFINGRKINASSIRNMYNIIHQICLEIHKIDISEIIKKDKDYINEYLNSGK